MSVYKLQMPGDYPEESIQHSEHGESLKSRTLHVLADSSARYQEFSTVHSALVYVMQV